ncbi:hypothetical protein A2625_06410 [candidate division WOR-1 bacterium RIFCSPHIGHO2_01_FULL_53_15]|uniref:Uncharacterized protein n=1 Tax=candidate division WOR-1 bacterium RIFCSPHIGHO2_01_FULL_53_15 TaxID=1802564 RepID=A0A1F4Q1C4_UNCSA|nr:MAG: hypothetical protein A2625_06410 [candidate division WOR-1 bacterium RIFCSPHIGHO2_01_FULL_53_15]OGC13786.1 MAG: hypothetical protein A3D23_01815 [candidate division WOR-1 bacterium RIFCSPHIGHO2_02_FULL_53_26]
MKDMRVLLGEKSAITPRSYRFYFRAERGAMRRVLDNILEHGVGHFAMKVFFGKKTLVWPKNGLDPKAEITPYQLVDELVKKDVSPGLFEAAALTIEAMFIDRYNAGFKIEAHLEHLSTKHLEKLGTTSANIQEFYRFTRWGKFDWLEKIGVVRQLPLEQKDINCGTRGQLRLF